MLKRFACVVLLAPVLAVPAAQADTAGAEDAVVIAVIDTLPSPYHWDFLASRMPQALNADPDDDLPLGQAPDTWLPGFASTASLATYEPLPLTLEQTDPDRSVAELSATDAEAWGGVQASSSGSVHYYWVPDTKVIGLVDFGGGMKAIPTTASLNAQHGANTSAVSTGALHGACPECLLVFISYSGGAANGEAAIEWAMDQPWIDAITNSYGFSLAVRDRLYSGSNVEAQRAAIERGQAVFFSAGNGNDGSFVVPNATYFSSQEGPDWITTVGAVTPGGTDYSGSGKMADLAAPGSSYPSIGGATVNGTGTFGGTSNATPVIAGLYGRALHRARRALEGPSRVQSGGVIATGTPIVCAAARPTCELGDGSLSSIELRHRLLFGAVGTTKGITPGGIGSAPANTAETRFASHGHGVYFARADAYDEDVRWRAEEARLYDPMIGAAEERAPIAGEQDWFVVDSYCRQQIWGAWGEGDFLDGVTPLPADDAVNWPVRSALAGECDRLYPIA